MKTAGIIAEYNPFHNGHLHQIETLRRQGFGTIICVMSPAVVQRGSFALFPFNVRVKAALCAGADLVITLPAPYACKSAEGFAGAAVYLLCALGVCDVLCFGAEGTGEFNAAEKLNSGNEFLAGEEFLSIAQALNTPMYNETLKQHLGGGITYAKARESAAKAFGIKNAQFLSRPNNILGIEYCRALINFYSANFQCNYTQAEITHFAKNCLPVKDVLPCKIKLPNKMPRPFVIYRKGANHDEPLAKAKSTQAFLGSEENESAKLITGASLKSGQFTADENVNSNTITNSSANIASATALRELFTHGKQEQMFTYVPKVCAEIYKSAVKTGQFINAQKVETALLSRLRGMTKEQFSQIRLAGEGLDNKLYKSVQKCNNLHELYSELKSKRYTHARIRRLVLDSALNYKSDLPSLVPFVHIAGASGAGLSALREIKKLSTLNISHSFAALAGAKNGESEQTADSIKHAEAVQKVVAAHCNAQDLAALCMEKTLPCGTAFTDKMVLV